MLLPALAMASSFGPTSRFPPAPSLHSSYGSRLPNLVSHKVFIKFADIGHSLILTTKAQVATLSDAAPVAQPVPRKRFSHLSDLLSQLSAGGDVSSSLEPWLDKLTLEDCNVLVAEVGDKDWNNAWQLFSVFREKSAVWGQSLVCEEEEPTQSEETSELGVRKAPASLKIYTTLVRVLSKYGRNEEIALLREEMKNASIEPDAAFFNTLFDAYGKNGLVGEISEALLQMEGAGIKPDHLTYEKLIMAHLRGENVELERPVQILKDMTKEGLPVGASTFKNLIKAFWRADDPDGAEEVFEAMQRADHTPDLKVILKLMQLHGRKGNYKRNLELLQMLKKLGIDTNGSVYDYLLHSYCKAGLIEQAQSTFLRYKSLLGSRPSIVAFNMLIDACGKQGLHEEAFQLYSDLCSSGLKPNTVTYSSIIAAMVTVEKFDKAEQLYRRMLKQIVQPNMHTYLTMIHGYTKRNWTRAGHEIYKTLKKSQLKMTNAAYGTVLALYVEGNWYGHAAAILKEMESEGFDMDAASNGLLIRSFGTLEDKMTPLATAVQNSTFEVCKLLTSLFLSNTSSKMEPELLDMLNSFLEKWNMLDDIEAKASIYNALMDCFWKKGLGGMARTILNQAREVFAGYTSPQLGEKDWVLDVRGLSIGGGEVALLDWLLGADEMAKNGLVDDTEMVLITGSGDFLPQLSQGDIPTIQRGLKGALLSMLDKLGSPFAESPDDSRRLQASAADVLKWISQDSVKQAMSLVDC